MIEFGGWEMPVQYSGIVDEHLAVRKAAGLFDISHMGELLFAGTGALDFLNHILTNDLRKLAIGQGQYTLLCNERGGVIDDLYAYRIRATEYLLIVNASRIEADATWIERQLAGWRRRQQLRFENASERFGAVALQGPKTPEFIGGCLPGPSVGGTEVPTASELKKNQMLIEAVGKHILATGHPYCLQPAGLGARDTLRTEVCYPLYGHELDEQTTPIEAGLGSFVALDKPDFIGRVVLAEQKASGVAKRCVAFRMSDKSAPPRPHYPIWSAGPNAAKLGEVTSGTQSPSLGAGIGLGYVPVSFAKPGTPIEIEIRGRRSPAVTVPKPIYRRASP